MRSHYLALTLLGIGCTAPPEEPPAEPVLAVKCEQVKQGDWTDQRVAFGRLSAPPDRSAEVAPEVSGRVSRVLVKVGDRVKSKDILAEINPDKASSSLQESRARLAYERANAEYLKQNKKRTDELARKGLVSEEAAQDADSRARQSAASVALAESQLNSAAIDLRRTKLAAPYSGTVVRILRGAGSTVDGTPATPVIELADADRLQLVASTAPELWPALRVGQPARVRLSLLKDVVLQGTVAVVSPGLDPSTGLGSVYIDVTRGEDADALPLGAFGEATISVGKSAAVSVPEAALNAAGSGTTQVAVCGEGALDVVSVEVVERRNGQARLVGGLKPGQRVVSPWLTGLSSGAAYREGD